MTNYLTPTNMHETNKKRMQKCFQQQSRKVFYAIQSEKQYRNSIRERKRGGHAIWRQPYLGPTPTSSAYPWRPVWPRILLALRDKNGRWGKFLRVILGEGEKWRTIWEVGAMFISWCHELLFHLFIWSCLLHLFFYFLF